MGVKEREDGMIVLENLTTTGGFRMGPRDKLDFSHILLMTKTMAEFHGSMYALKYHQRESFDNLVTSLKTFPFSKQEKNSFDAFYAIALERLKRYAEDKCGNLETTVMRLYDKYIKKPSSLLQEFLKEDRDFDIIIHGDYNRNNVMFKYQAEEDGSENPISVKMFDFQWLKCASPVLDISFYLYMNLDPDLFQEKFDEILKFYHRNLVATFKTISISHGKEFNMDLSFLSYTEFMKHFKKYAFYGCLISTWFLPVMLADLKTCQELAAELSKDMFSKASMKVVLSAGGDEAFHRVVENVRHAFERGYLDELLN
jgi:hypothetical protein